LLVAEPTRERERLNSREQAKSDDGDIHEVEAWNQQQETQLQDCPVDGTDEDTTYWTPIVYTHTPWPIHQWTAHSPKSYEYGGEEE
jgi:hypothetical protein